MEFNHDSETLYRACLEDGTDAQIDAFTALWEQLYRIAYGMLHAYPDAQALAADCAQTALIKVHRHLRQCNDPRTFRGWAAQIARRSVLDAVRQRALTHTVRIEEHEALPDAHPAAADSADDDLRAVLLTAISHGPLSDRSRRVVLGRFFDEHSDDVLAQIESRESEQPILPSHIQVTRSKNLSKLRNNPALVAQLRELLEE